MRLREASGGAFDPCWRGNGKLDYGAIALFVLSDGSKAWK